MSLAGFTTESPQKSGLFISHTLDMIIKMGKALLSLMLILCAFTAASIFDVPHIIKWRVDAFLHPKSSQTDTETPGTQQKATEENPAAPSHRKTIGSRTKQGHPVNVSPQAALGSQKNIDDGSETPPSQKKSEYLIPTSPPDNVGETFTEGQKNEIFARFRSQLPIYKRSLRDYKIYGAFHGEACRDLADGAYAQIKNTIASYDKYNGLFSGNASTLSLMEEYRPYIEEGKRLLDGK